MKRKKPAVVPAVEMEQPVSSPVTDWETSHLDKVWACLFSALLFVSMTIQTGRMALILAALALALSIGKGPLRRLRERMCVPVLGLVAFAVMNGLAAIYSSFGSYAVSEFYKIIAAFSMVVILLTRFDKKHIRGLLWGVSAVCALIALISIDAVSAGLLFRPFNSLMELLGTSFSNLLQNIEGTRITGIYNDANVSGNIFALGSLIALYLTITAEKRRSALVACLMLGICAHGFFLSTSRGAILCFALALLVWLLTVEKTRRMPLFFLSLAAALVTVATSMVSMRAVNTASLLPDLMALVSGLLVFGLWLGVSRTALVKLAERSGRVILVTVLALAVLAGGYLLAATRITAPYTFESESSFSRSLHLDGGEYVVSGDWDSDLTLIITMQENEKDVLAGKYSTLYYGAISIAEFTVPQGGGTVEMRFASGDGNTIRSVVLSDGTSVPLDYPLLPRFLVNRLQGDLLSSSSFLMRVQYLKDGWKLFAKSPLLGHGLGASEGLLTSVQPFFYESKYLHCHVLQVMVEMGLLGLIGFLMLLGGTLWLLLKGLRTEERQLAAVLLACWVMINTHSLMEINFSIRAYQCLAYTMMLLAVVCFGRPISEKVVKVGGWILAGCIWAYLAVFGALLESHRMVEREVQEFSTNSVSEFMGTLESYIRRDVFDHEQNQLTYVGNAVLLDDSRYNGNMQRYAEKLRASGTYTACSGLAQYYYLPRGQFEDLFACSREGIAQEASAADAWNLQLDFYRNDVLAAAGAEHMDEFTDGVLALQDYLDEYSQGRMEEIALSDENQMFLNAVSSVRESGMEAENAWMYLTEILGYGQVE